VKPNNETKSPELGQKRDLKNPEQAPEPKQKRQKTKDESDDSDSSHDDLFDKKASAKKEDQDSDEDSLFNQAQDQEKEKGEKVNAPTTLPLAPQQPMNIPTYVGDNVDSGDDDNDQSDNSENSEEGETTKNMIVAQY